MNTGNMGTLLLMALTVLGLARARPMDYLCKEGGRTYIDHPTDCEKFVQCHRDASGNLIGEIQNCPFSTYWSQDFLTCLPVQQIPCQSDKCAGQSDGTIRVGDNNCRAFWECNNGKSEPKCCPMGQKFDGMLGCVETKNEDDECKDTCLGVEYNWSNETANETIVCNKTPVLGEPGFYMEEAVGMIFKRPCPVGTVFDQDKCECDLAKDKVNKAVCKREIYLPFTTDHIDMSGNHHVGNENVIVQNGLAYFNGEDSRLSIPFFNNKEHVDTIVIRINYTSASGNGRYPQVLVSNSGCGFLPSIVITEDEEAVAFKIGTTKNLMSSISVPQPGVPIEKVVEFKYLNEIFTGSVNDLSSDVAVNGFLRNVQCDLSIGGLPQYANNQLKDMENFKGVINELSVYLCNPELTQ